MEILNTRKNIFACLLSIHNTSLSWQEHILGYVSRGTSPILGPCTPLSSHVCDF